MKITVCIFRFVYLGLQDIRIYLIQYLPLKKEKAWGDNKRIEIDEIGMVVLKSSKIGNHTW